MEWNMHFRSLTAHVWDYFLKNRLAPNDISLVNMCVRWPASVHYRRSDGYPNDNVRGLSNTTTTMLWWAKSDLSMRLRSFHESNLFYMRVLPKIEQLSYFLRRKTITAISIWKIRITQSRMNLISFLSSFFGFGKVFEGRPTDTTNTTTTWTGKWNKSSGSRTFKEMRRDHFR